MFGLLSFPGFSVLSFSLEIKSQLESLRSGAQSPTPSPVETSTSSTEKPLKTVAELEAELKVLSWKRFEIVLDLVRRYFTSICHELNLFRNTVDNLLDSSNHFSRRFSLTAFLLESVMVSQRWRVWAISSKTNISPLPWAARLEGQLDLGKPTSHSSEIQILISCLIRYQPPQTLSCMNETDHPSSLTSLRWQVVRSEMLDFEDADVNLLFFCVEWIIVVYQWNRKWTLPHLNRIFQKISPLKSSCRSFEPIRTIRFYFGT